MIPVNQDYINYLSNKAFSPYSKIIVDGVSYLGNVIKTFPKIKHQATNIAGSFPAKTVSFEIYDNNNNLDFQNKEIEVYKGFLINNQVEYIKQGTFIPRAENITRNISTKVISFKDVQDRTQLLENTYKSDLNYSNGQTHTGLEIVQEICTKRNITLLNNNFAFANYNFPQPNFYETITEREVIARLAEIGGETAFFNYNGYLTIKGQNNSNMTIPRSRYEKISKEKTITYNTVVLGKEGIDDDIVYPTNMSENDRVAFKILDNPYVDLIRESIISEVASHIIGLSYIPSELTGFIDGFIFELNDYITVVDRNNTTSKLVIMDYESTSRYKCNAKCKFNIDSQSTNYKIAGSNQQAINSVKFEVNHIDQTVTSVISQTTDTTNPDSLASKQSVLTQRVDSLESAISDIADITTSGESSYATLDLDNINESEPIVINVKPVNTNISYLYPRNNLYPSDTLYMPDRKIRFHNRTTNENIDYLLPDDLLWYDSTHYDEFMLDYNSQTCKVTKKCKYNADGTVGLLSSTQIDEYSFPEIDLTEGNYTISILGYSAGYIFVRLMTNNIYTDQFYTKAESNSIISQTASNITASVNQTLTNYSTTAEMNSAISVTATSINSTVATKVGKEEVISSINQSSEQVSINAGKINISGVVTAINGGSTTIDGSKITTGTINASQINVGAITNGKLADDSVTSTKIASGSITTDKLTANCVTASKVSSDIITTNNFSAQNINANKITSGTLSTNRLDSDVITTSNFSAQNIDASKITSGTLSTNRLSSDVITTSNFSAQEISAGNITSGTLSVDRLSAKSITGTKIADSTITSAKISTLNAGKISGGTITGVAFNNGSGTFSVTSGGYITASSGKIGGWSLSSSKLYGTSSGTQYSIRPYGVANDSAGTEQSWGRIMASASDENLKHDIKNIEEKYDAFFDDLKPKTFYYNKGVLDTKKHIGFIAQDVLKAEKKIDEDLSMVEKPEESQYYNLYKEEIIALNTWQIQKIKQENKELKNVIDELRQEIEELKKGK